MENKMKKINWLIASFFTILIFTSFNNVFADEPVMADTTKNYTIDNCVNSFDMKKALKTSVGYQYWFIGKDFLDGRTLKLSAVAPHQATHAPHVHPEDEIFYILEGNAEFYLDGKTITVGPNTSFYCPSNVKHGIKNVGDTELKYLVVKKYQN